MGSKNRSDSGTEMKILRIRLGLTQAEFAARFHVGRRAVQSWEQGRTPVPEHVEYLIARVLDLEDEVARMEAEKMAGSGVGDE